MSLKLSNQETVHSAVLRAEGGWRDFMRTVVVLFKLRIVSLLLLAAVGGAFLGAGGWPGLGRLVVLLLAGGAAASGASALNQYIERTSDVIMSRTRLRPLPSGQIRHPHLVVAVALFLVLAPPLALRSTNRALAFYLLLGAFIYVVVYTVLLKPRTLLNIVIGGAAGSAAVMSGGAAVGAAGDPAVITLALLVFLWTPSHFWSLAILYKEDYVRADVPMLPTRISLRTAAWWVLLHTGATIFAALMLGLSPVLGLAYLLPVLGASVDLLWRNGRLIRQPTPRNARSLFIASNVYLTVVLLALLVSSTLHPIWPLL